MKKKRIYMVLTLLWVAIMTCTSTGCDDKQKDNNQGIETTTESSVEITTDGLANDLEQLGSSLDALQLDAINLNNKGYLSDEDYENIVGLIQKFEVVEATDKSQDIESEIDELEKLVTASESKLNEIKDGINSKLIVNLENLVEGMKELKSILDTKYAEGGVTEDKILEVNGYIENVSGYIEKLNGDITEEEREDIENQAGAIKGNVVVIAGEVSSDNTLINKLMGIS